MYLDVQGQKVLIDFDIRKEAGGSNIAVVKSFNKTNVTANFLEIHFFWAGKGTCCIPFQGTYGPLVSAISVTPGNDKGYCVLLNKNVLDITVFYGILHQVQNIAVK